MEEKVSNDLSEQRAFVSSLKKSLSLTAINSSSSHGICIVRFETEFKRATGISNFVAEQSFTDSRRNEKKKKKKRG